MFVNRKSDVEAKTVRSVILMAFFYCRKDLQDQCYISAAEGPTVLIVL